MLPTESTNPTSRPSPTLSFDSGESVSILSSRYQFFTDLYPGYALHRFLSNFPVPIAGPRVGGVASLASPTAALAAALTQNVTKLRPLSLPSVSPDAAPCQPLLPPDVIPISTSCWRPLFNKRSCGCAVALKLHSIVSQRIHKPRLESFYNVRRCVGEAGHIRVIIGCAHSASSRAPLRQVVVLRLFPKGISFQDTFNHPC